jgi:hypothetical protein
MSARRRAGIWDRAAELVLDLARSRICDSLAALGEGGSVEVVLVLWFLCGIAGAIIYSNKGHEGCAGFALGFLLGPIGVVIALVVKPNDQALENRALSSGEMRKCPSCAELIRTEARKCRFCGSELPALPSNYSDAEARRRR